MPNSDNHALVGKALLLLRQGLRPFAEREMSAAGRETYDRLPSNRFSSKADSDDAAGLLSIILSNWNGVFGQKLGKIERALAFELREHRNSWAHQKAFDEDDTYRVLDSAERFLRAIGADDDANAVKELRAELRQAKGAGNKVIVLSSNLAVPASNRPFTAVGVRGKYRPLHDHLRRVKDDRVIMSFREIELVLGQPLPPSAYKYPAWWANQRDGRHVEAISWMEAGFRVEVDIDGKRATFRRSQPF